MNLGHFFVENPLNMLKLYIFRSRFGKSLPKKKVVAHNNKKVRKVNSTQLPMKITYNKGCRGRNEAFHPSIPSSIHGWHHTGKKTLVEINNPAPRAPLRMCCCLGKACPALGGSNINIRPKGPNTP